MRSPLGTEVHTECKKAVEIAAALLEKMGHRVEEAEPRIDGLALAKSYFMLYFGEVAADIEELKKILGRKPNHTDIEETTWALNLLGRTFSAGEFVLSMREWNTFSRQMGMFHQTYDLYLTHIIASLPVRIGELKQKPVEELLMKIINSLNMGALFKISGVADMLAIKGLSKTPFTQLANLTGQPAMSVPLHWTPEGLPCGVQFIARFGEESVLFRITGQIESAKPWFDRHPKI